MSKKPLEPKKPAIPKDDAKAWRKEALRLKKELEKLVAANIQAMNALDAIMKAPEGAKWTSSTEPFRSLNRGSAVAKVLNALEMANDSARHFGLGISFKSKQWLKDKKPP